MDSDSLDHALTKGMSSQLANKSMKSHSEKNVADLCYRDRNSKPAPPLASNLKRKSHILDTRHSYASGQVIVVLRHIEYPGKSVTLVTARAAAPAPLDCKLDLKSAADIVDLYWYQYQCKNIQTLYPQCGNETYGNEGRFVLEDFVIGRSSRLDCTLRVQVKDGGAAATGRPGEQARLSIEVEGTVVTGFERDIGGDFVAWVLTKVELVCALPPQAVGNLSVSHHISVDDGEPSDLSC